MHMLDSNSSVDMVYLDFSEAFDKVDHGTLLHKLRAVGITGNIGIWLLYFITDRSHFLRLHGGISADHPMLSGVPCCCCLPSVTYGRNGVTPIFQIFYRTFCKYTLHVCYVFNVENRFGPSPVLDYDF